MTHPAPNSELTSESVKLLKAGDVLRHEVWGVAAYKPQSDPMRADDYYLVGPWTFIGRPDADGWMPHDGGPNPLSGVTLDVRWNDGGTWADMPPEPALKWKNIIAFRLVAPSVERDGSSADADTHRATDDQWADLKAWAESLPPEYDVGKRKILEALAARAQPPVGEVKDDCLHKAIGKMRAHAAAIQVGKAASKRGERTETNPILDCVNDLPNIIRQLEDAEFEIDAAFERYEDAHPAEPAAREGGEVVIVPLAGAPYPRTLLDDLNGFATGGSNRCRDALLAHGVTFGLSALAAGGEK